MRSRVDGLDVRRFGRFLGVCPLDRRHLGRRPLGGCPFGRCLLGRCLLGGRFCPGGRFCLGGRLLGGLLLGSYVLSLGRLLFPFLLSFLTRLDDRRIKVSDDVPVPSESKPGKVERVVVLADDGQRCELTVFGELEGLFDCVFSISKKVGTSWIRPKDSFHFVVHNQVRVFCHDDSPVFEIVRQVRGGLFTAVRFETAERHAGVCLGAAQADSGNPCGIEQWVAR